MKKIWVMLMIVAVASPAFAQQKNGHTEASAKANQVMQSAIEKSKLKQTKGAPTVSALVPGSPEAVEVQRAADEKALSERAEKAKSRSVEKRFGAAPPMFQEPKKLKQKPVNKNAK